MAINTPVSRVTRRIRAEPARFFSDGRLPLEHPLEQFRARVALLSGLARFDGVQDGAQALLETLLL
jgi:hypothetical protein